MERNPDAVAIVHGPARLTYRELNQQANRLAHHLRTLGAAPETLVGVCMERSLEMVVGLLAVLKAGGAYVPLDPTHPVERLRFMFADARPGILLTQERLLPTLPDYSGLVLCVDRDRGRWETGQDANPAPLTGPANLAYVIYTSGSTGRPKAVLVAQRGVVNYLVFIAKAYELGAADVVLPLSSICFDPSVRDIFGPLTSGARIVLMRDQEVLDPQAVLAEIARHNVTRILAITPSTLRPLLTTAEDNGLVAASIRTILVSGEPLHRLDVARARTFARNAVIVNHYGPTETTMTATCHVVGPAELSGRRVPVGRPIDNVQVYVLDEDLKPVPFGAAGEVHIGGAGVARGYLNRPELTAEKFVPNPFVRGRGARLYRTGDLGRYLPDGTLELLGRADQQVKIRGVRVELGEIEALLCEHANVREAAVILREDELENRQLTAYVVAPPDGDLDAHELRRFLKARLPGYMVPADFVRIEALPRTPNRKVDRRNLPAPDRSRRDREQNAAPPRTEIEKLVAGMWAKVFKVDRVGISDDFFELGGHSLLAGRLLTQVCRHFRVDVRLRAFFDAPTVAGLAKAVARAMAERP